MRKDTTRSLSSRAAPYRTASSTWARASVTSGLRLRWKATSRSRSMPRKYRRSWPVRRPSIYGPLPQAGVRRPFPTVVAQAVAKRKQPNRDPSASRTVSALCPTQGLRPLPRSAATALVHGREGRPTSATGLARSDITVASRVRPASENHRLQRSPSFPFVGAGNYRAFTPREDKMGR